VFVHHDDLSLRIWPIGSILNRDIRPWVLHEASYDLLVDDHSRYVARLD
jgi:hypothetical protein